MVSGALNLHPGLHPAPTVVRCVDHRLSGACKILEEHAAVADLALIDRTIRLPDERRADPRPGRERFFRREAGVQVLAVVEFGEVPAIIVTVFASDRTLG